MTIILVRNKGIIQAKVDKDNNLELGIEQPDESIVTLKLSQTEFNLIASLMSVKPRIAPESISINHALTTEYQSKEKT